MNESSRVNDVISRATQAIVLVYQALALIVFVSGLFLAVNWLKIPFIGGFFEQTMVLNGSDTSQPGQHWALYQQRFQRGDQLDSVNGHLTSSAERLQQTLDSLVVGQTVPVTMRTGEGQLRTVNVTLQPFPTLDRISYFLIPGFLSLMFLGISLWTFGLRRTEPAGQAFSIMSASLAIVTGALFDAYTSHRFTYLWTLAVALSGGALIDLGLCFPQETQILSRRPYLRQLGSIIGIGLALSAYVRLYDFQYPTAYIASWRAIYIFVGASALFYFGVLTFRSFFSDSPVVKNQARTILLGSLLAFGPIIVWSLYSSGINIIAGSGNSPPLNPYLVVPFIFFPLANGYVIQRFRLLRTDYWVRQGVIYSALTVFVVAVYALLALGLGSVFAIPYNNPYLIGALVFIIAVALDPLRTRLQTLVDSTFFRGQRAFEERLRTFSHELTNASNLRAIARVLRGQISNSLVPDRLHIYLYDPLRDQYAALANEDGVPTSDIRFASNSPLVQYFQKENIPLYLDAINPPTVMQSDAARLSLLGTRLFVALPGEERPVGWLALGNPLSGIAYTPQDLDFLQNLADQSSLAISRIQAIVDLEGRVQELNALARVSQGVNVTLTFDDVLELIFAQTSQIIPSSLFHITLYNQAAKYFYYAFRVDDNERIMARENQPLPPSLGLGQEIIRKQRPILTQDYARECQARNIVPSAQRIYTWMGVPLNSGSETIGCLSVGSDDPRVTYTSAQLNLLQAIADQTVGGLIKARLLQETLQRAHQLSTLNAITRQLTSTLEQEPLLRNILESAVGILNCEAGTVFLIDEGTGELIFRVTAGPVSSELLGQRLPAGAGIAGKAAQSGRPVVENDGQRSTIRYAGFDRETRFTSRTLLAAPMMIKDRVLGVIEVINRRDGLPFVEDDQSLLTALADQAAVAMENARLLDLTDQELTARVEELQVMGRIVRELNASLEVARAMRTTLEWAMRRSNAEAGLIGMIEGDHLRLMAQQGYDDILTDVESQVSLELPALRSALESGQSNQISVANNGAKRILPSAHTQIIVPIRRETQVIGLLLLESTSDSQGNLSFLNQLSDSAAIAIANAQLFDEVQRTNQANVKLTELDKKKNEFLSIVSHELRTPLTPVQSCIQNLLAGEYGPLNDKQRSRLEIALRNTREEARLINNLLDLARIEEGREQLKLETGNLAKIIKDVMTIFEYDAENKQIELINLVTFSDHLEITMDLAKIKQVVTNLINNAIKFTPPNGKITVSDLSYPDKVEILVKDTGMGIPLEEQSKIFERFYQVDTTLTRKIGGTGIGLNIVKTYVELHHGAIWVESTPGSGSTFHFTLPN